ncbi:MAG: MFS transporter [Planctomycetes bacterium]|nr:MFS transporter [Planctomycetota bacterium]
MDKFINLPATVHLLCVGSFINRAAQFLVVFLTIYLTQSLGYPEWFAGVCMGAFGVGSVGASLVGGHLADIIGRKIVMMSGMFGGGAVLVVFSYVSDPLAIVGVIAAFAFVSEMYRPASSAMIADVVSPQERPHAFTLMYLAINLGFAVAPPTGGFLISHFSFKWLFLCDALTSAVFGLIILVAIKETLPRRMATSDADRPSSKIGESVPWKEAASHILCDRVFMVFCLATFCVAMAYLQGMSTFPMYLNRLGIDVETYSRIIMVNGIMIVVLQIPVTGIVIKRNRVTVLAIASVVTAIGFGLKSIAQTPVHFALTVMIWTTGEMMAVPLVSAIVADLAPVRLRARYMGVFSTSFSGANMVAAPVGSAILVVYGGPFLWKVCLGLCIVSALLYLSIGSAISVQKADRSNAETQ